MKSGDRRKADFIGIGAQKCATSWVYNALGSHPEVFVSEPKELDFFSCHYNLGFSWYEQHFISAKGERAIGEFSPSYLHDLSAPARAFDYNPGMKIIVVLRDPVERAYSNHLHEVRSGRVPETCLDFKNGIKNNPMYLEQSRYYSHLQRWYSVFPREQIICMFQEDISKAPLAELERLYRFLCVDENHVPDSMGRKANVSRIIRFQGLSVITGTVRRIMLLLGLKPLVAYLSGSRPLLMLKRLNSRDLRKLVPPVDEETREWCRKQLEEDAAQLKGLLGVEKFPWEDTESNCA